MSRRKPGHGHKATPKAATPRQRRRAVPTGHEGAGPSNAMEPNKTDVHTSAEDGPDAPRWRGQEVVIAERRIRALDLRKGGLNYRQIAKACGVSLDTAYGDVQAEMQQLRDLAVAGAEDLRELERQRLDRYCATMTALADGPGRTPIERIKAVAVLVRIQERRAKLEGTDAPKRVEHSGHVDGTLALTTINLDDLDEAQLLALREIALARETADKAAAEAS